jgi:hypothetical protein
LRGFESHTPHYSFLVLQKSKNKVVGTSGINYNSLYDMVHIIKWSWPSG